MVNCSLDDIIKRQAFHSVSENNTQLNIEMGGVPKRLSNKSIPLKIISQIIKSIVNNNGCVTRSQIIRETSLCLSSQVDLVFKKLGLLEALYVCSNGRKLPVTNGGITLYDVIASIRENSPESMKEVFKYIAEKCEYDCVKASELIGVHKHTFQGYIIKYYSEWKKDKMQYMLNKFKREFLETLKKCNYSQNKTCKMLGITEYSFRRFVEHCNIENWMELKRDYKKQHKIPVTIIDNTVFIHAFGENNLQKKGYITPMEIIVDRNVSKQAVWGKIVKDTLYIPSTPRVKRDIRITREAYKQLYKRVR